MNEAERFNLEMMSMPELAKYCHRLKDKIDIEAHELSLGRGNIENKRKMMKALKVAKTVLKLRQMKLF